MAIDEVHAERDHSEQTEVFSASASRDACRASVPGDQRIFYSMHLIVPTSREGIDTLRNVTTIVLRAFCRSEGTI